MHKISRFRPLLVLTSLALAALVGCATDAPPIGLVSGTVTHDGKPVPNLTVSFMPENGRPSWGMTDASGYYSLHWDVEHDGAEVGNHKVSVAYIPGSQADEPGRTKAAPAPAAANRDDIKTILGKYGFEKSPLTQEVKPGRQTIDLKLD